MEKAVKKAEKAKTQEEKPLTDKQRRFLVALERCAGNIKKTCESEAISRQTHYDWLDNSDTYKKEFWLIMEGLKDMVESALMMNIMGGNVTAQIFWLKTRAKDRGYIERFEVDNEPPDMPDPVQVLLPDNGRGDGG